MGVDRLEDLDESWLLPAQAVVRDDDLAGRRAGLSDVSTLRSGG